MTADPFKVARGRGRFKDLTGHEFGWLRIERRLPSPDKKTRWLCSCRCGRSDVVAKVDLLNSGKKRDCGCREKQRVCTIGRRFGALTVTSRLQVSAHNHECQCRCVCGQNLTVSISDLMSRRTLNCGCGSTIKINRPQRERAIQMYQSGMSAAQVGKAIGRSKYVVIEWIRSSGRNPRPHPSKKWNEDQKRAAMKLYASGQSLGAVSKLIGCCSSALARWLKDAGYKMRRRADYTVPKMDGTRPQMVEREDAPAARI